MDQKIIIEFDYQPELRDALDLIFKKLRDSKTNFPDCKIKTVNRLGERQVGIYTEIIEEEI